MRNNNKTSYQRSISKSKKLGLQECKAILNQNGNNYTDEDILLIRDWLERLADIFVEDELSKPKE